MKQTKDSKPVICSFCDSKANVRVLPQTTVYGSLTFIKEYTCTNEKCGRVWVPRKENK